MRHGPCSAVPGMDALGRARACRVDVGPLAVAAAVLGAGDALIAVAHGAGIAPGRALPLCLTAPFVIAAVVLAPATALASLVTACRPGCGVEPGSEPVARTALLLGVAGALAALRLASGWPALVPAIVAFAASRRGALAVLRRVPATHFVRLALVAAVLHVAALAGVAWQWRREGRGLERDLVAMPAPAGSVSSSSPPAAHPANVVLVTIDTLRADHLDDARMPRTAALAREGVRFTQAFAASSWTLPSVASLMTGLPVAAHGAGAALGPDLLSRAPLDPAHATLASVLRAAGFATRAVVTNPYLALGYGLGHGFDAYENVTLESEAVLTLAPTIGFGTLARLVPALAVADRGDAVTARAARFLRSAPDGRFLLWLHYVDPHAPYDGATRSFRDELLAGGGVTTRLPRMAQLRAGEIRPDPAGRATMRAAYARAVRSADEEVGRIADLLEETGLARTTLLVVTADHGEELWDRGGVEHGHTLHDEVVRVPLVIRCPGCAPRGVAFDTPVATAALAPTLLDLLGVRAAAGDADEAALGPDRGFASLLRGQRRDPQPIVSEGLLFAEERVALRTARHTFVVWPSGKEELYDRARDPRELHDLAAREALVRRHRRLLAAARGDGLADVTGARDPRASPASAVPAGEGARLRRGLAALGYVE